MFFSTASRPFQMTPLRSRTRRSRRASGSQLRYGGHWLQKELDRETGRLAGAPSILFQAVRWRTRSNASSGPVFAKVGYCVSRRRAARTRGPRGNRPRKFGGRWCHYPIIAIACALVHWSLSSVIALVSAA